MKKLNIKTVYSITQYKNGVHQLHDTVKVKSKSGKTFHIGKSQNNAGEATFWLGTKPNFELSATDYRKSKTSVVNFLNKNKKP